MNRPTLFDVLRWAAMAALAVWFVVSCADLTWVTGV